MGEILSIWTLFDRPTDAPDCYVVRRFEVHLNSVKATSDAHYSLHIERLRNLMLERGLHCIGRSEGDEPQIVESWI